MLHDGSIAEMKTGEGKTLVSTLAAYLNALSGEGVHGMSFLLFLLIRNAEMLCYTSMLFLLLNVDVLFFVLHFSIAHLKFVRDRTYQFGIVRRMSYGA